MPEWVCNFLRTIPSEDEPEEEIPEGERFVEDFDHPIFYPVIGATER